jgi:hypothetical protein
MGKQEFDIPEYDAMLSALAEIGVTFSQGGSNALAAMVMEKRDVMELVHRGFDVRLVEHGTRRTRPRPAQSLPRFAANLTKASEN